MSALRSTIRHTRSLAALPLAAAAAFLLSGCPARPKDASGKPAKPPPPVNMTVEVGQAGAARQGQVVPIKVTLGQNEKPITGTLELDNLEGRRTEMPVELPRQSNKVYTLFAPLSQSSSRLSGEWAEVRVREGGRVLAKQLLTPVNADAKVLLSCTDDGSGLQFLDDRRRYRVAHLLPRDLPQQWAGYEPASVVALNGRAWAAMSPEQRKALRTWVEQGGRAILCGEALNEWRDPDGQSLAAITPARIATRTSLDCLDVWGEAPFRAAAGSILTVSGTPLPGAFSHSGQELMEREVLAGRVLWMGFDPFRETFRNWDGYERFWRRVLDRAERAPTAAPPVNDPDQVDSARSAASSLPRLPTPPMPVIIAFGVVYAVIFGPVNIWVLRRLRRTVKAWLFVPTLALVMTVVVLFAGQMWGSARTVLNSVSILQASQGSRSAREVSLIGLFSPTNRSFDLAVEDVAPVLEDRGSTDPQVSDQIRLDWPELQSEGMVRWSSVPIVLFSTRLLHLDRPRDLAGSVEARLAWADATRPAGSVTNGSNLKLRGAYLFCAGRYHWLGDLGAGASAKIGSGWKPRLEGSLAAQKAGQLIENETFRENVESLWRNAPDQLLNGAARRDAWLIAECDGYRSGLSLSQIPYSNQAGLLLVRLPRGDR